MSSSIKVKRTPLTPIGTTRPKEQFRIPLSPTQTSSDSSPWSPIPNYSPITAEEYEAYLALASNPLVFRNSIDAVLSAYSDEQEQLCASDICYRAIVEVDNLSAELTAKLYELDLLNLNVIDSPAVDVVPSEAQKNLFAFQPNFEEFADFSLDIMRDEIPSSSSS